MGAPNPIHLRYLRTATGRARIDLSVESAQAIYNRFDDPVPYPNRNLDPALVQYLVDCATELDPEPFAVWFHVPRLPEPEVEQHARQSLALYFRYRVELERRQRSYEVQRTAILAAAGVTLLAAVTYASTHGLNQDSVAIALAVQGTTVAAWVMLWEAFGAWLVRWIPFRSRIRVFRALAEAEVAFVSDQGSA